LNTVMERYAKPPDLELAAGYDPSVRIGG
jgi:hypothetical protein